MKLIKNLPAFFIFLLLFVMFCIKFKNQFTKLTKLKSAQFIVLFNEHYSQLPDQSKKITKNKTASAAVKSYELNSVRILEIIKNRIRTDRKRIDKICEKYLESIDAWKANDKQFHELNYFLDENKKLGYCLNAKVSLNIVIYSYFICTVIIFHCIHILIHYFKYFIKDSIF